MESRQQYVARKQKAAKKAAKKEKERRRKQRAKERERREMLAQENTPEVAISSSESELTVEERPGFFARLGNRGALAYQRYKDAQQKRLRKEKEKRRRRKLKQPDDYIILEQAWLGVTDEVAAPQAVSVAVPARGKGSRRPPSDADARKKAYNMHDRFRR